MTDRLISSWRKNSREIVQVRLKSYNGAILVDSRVYFANEAGQLCPTRKGIALNTSQVSLLRDALTEALRVFDAM